MLFCSGPPWLWLLKSFYLLFLDVRQAWRERKVALCALTHCEFLWYLSPALKTTLMRSKHFIHRRVRDTDVESRLTPCPLSKVMVVGSSSSIWPSQPCVLSQNSTKHELPPVELTVNWLLFCYYCTHGHHIHADYYFSSKSLQLSKIVDNFSL